MQKINSLNESKLVVCKIKTFSGIINNITTIQINLQGLGKIYIFLQKKSETNKLSVSIINLTIVLQKITNR